MTKATQLGLTFVFCISFVAGLAAGLTVNHDWDMQNAYADGRNSVLNQIVTIGAADGSPCTLEVPLASLAEMVNIGVLRWQKMCEATHDND